MRGLVVVMCACMTFVGVGCSSDDSSSPDSTVVACDPVGTGSAAGSGSASTFAATTAVGSCPVGTVPIATSTTAAATTTTPVTVDPAAAVIADCAAYIPIGAFTGNQEATDLWAFVSQDPTRLEALCTQLQIDNPSMLATFSANYAAVMSAAVTTTTVTSP